MVHLYEVQLSKETTNRYANFPSLLFVNCLNTFFDIEITASDSMGREY
jgi:hypothetical protein